MAKSQSGSALMRWLLLLCLLNVSIGSDEVTVEDEFFEDETHVEIEEDTEFEEFELDEIDEELLP